MTKTINRDAADIQALAEAVAVWLARRDDEADILLDGVLLEQGVITPDEVIEQIVAHSDDSVSVRLDSDEVFVISRNGQTCAA